MKWLFFLAISLLFTGCNLFESQEEQAKIIANEKIAFEKRVEESKEIQLKKLSAQTQKELAILESKKELALIKKEQAYNNIPLYETGILHEDEW